MKQFKIWTQEIRQYCFLVEAKTKEDAIDKFESSTYPLDEAIDDYGESEGIVEVEEVE